MKAINKIFILAAMAAAFTGCSDSDDAPLPGPKMENFFAVADSDQSPEAQLRRDFFTRTGIYLVFSDTLASYTDDFGNNRYETIDFNWELTDKGLTTYRFTQLADYESKKEVADNIEKYFVPYINIEGGRFKPYSIYLSGQLEHKRNTKWVKDPFIQCWRSLGVSGNNWIDADREEAVDEGLSLLRAIVESRLNYNSEELVAFFEPCQDYYYEYCEDFIDGWDSDDPDIDAIYRLGFLDYDDWGDEFLSKDDDLAMFMEAVFEETEEDFMEEWGDYPIIIQRYQTLRQTIIDLGVDFNAVKL